MLKVGLTGNIGCGKSTISSLLEMRDYHIIDADLITRDIYEYDDVVERMEIYFPTAIKNNTVDRKILGEIVFSDKDKLLTLNRIVHDKILSIIEMRIDLYSRIHGDGGVVIIDGALLYETNFDKNLDKMVVVYCREDEQLNRILDRDNLTVPQALSRINSQQDQNEKVKKADYVVDNSGSVEELYGKIDVLEEKILEWLDSPAKGNRGL